jgi:hypothetical protein
MAQGGQAGTSGETAIGGAGASGDAPRFCVASCSTSDRVPAIANEQGSLSCPDDHPRFDTECEIVCDALYARSEEYSCGAGSYCVRTYETTYADDCIGDGEGEDPECLCGAVPEVCDNSVTRRVCGYDGLVYPNRCEAHRARVDLPGAQGTCAEELDGGLFLCGGIYCQTGVEVCTIVGPPDEYSVANFRCEASECAVEGGCDCVFASDPEEFDGACCLSETDGMVRMGSFFSCP